MDMANVVSVVTYAIALVEFFVILYIMNRMGDYKKCMVDGGHQMIAVRWVGLECTFRCRSCGFSYTVTSDRLSEYEKGLIRESMDVVFGESELDFDAISQIVQHQCPSNECPGSESCPDMNDMGVPVLPDPLEPEPGFLKELEGLINKYSKESGSNTPDFILAECLTRALADFDALVSKREHWYGRGTRKREQKDESNV